MPLPLGSPTRTWTVARLVRGETTAASEQSTEQPVGSAPNIPWCPSLRKARKEAHRDGKLVLVYLWHNQCGGSKTMGEKTYPEEAANSYLEQHFAPVRFNKIQEQEPAPDEACGGALSPSNVGS